MNTPKTVHQKLAVLLLFAVLTEKSQGQIYLTGLLQQGADAQTGQSVSTPIWNTLGNELSFANLYVTQPSGGYMAPFLNHGNGADASISYALTPGSYSNTFRLE
jgi:hypothetical protein